MSCYTVQQPKFLTSPFKLIENIIIVKAKLNGYQRNFLFDSGASDLILNKRYINKKNQIESDKKFHAINSAGDLTNTVLKNFNWNGLTLKNKLVNAINFRHLEAALNIKIYGLIGYKQIRDYALHINYKTKQLYMWDSTEKTPFKVVSKVDFVMHKHIPVFPVTIGTKQFNMGLDTGAAANLLHIKHQKKISKHLKFLTESILSGGSEITQKIKVYQLDAMLANKASYKKMKFLFSNIDHLNKTINEIDGLLGYQFLKYRQTIINFPNCEIQFIRKKPEKK